MFIEPIYTLVLQAEENGGLKVRPGAKEFLLVMSEFYDIVLFSSRKSSLLDKIAEILDPENKIIKQKISRKSCFLTKSKKFFKNLEIIKNKNLKDMLIIDYKPQSFFPNLDNGVLIPHWNGDEFDDQLNKEKKDFLIEISKEHNIPFRLKARLKMYTIMDIVLNRAPQKESNRKKKKVIIDFNKKKNDKFEVSTPTTKDEIVNKNKDGKN